MNHYVAQSRRETCFLVYHRMQEAMEIISAEYLEDGIQDDQQAEGDNNAADSNQDPNRNGNQNPNQHPNQHPNEHSNEHPNEHPNQHPNRNGNQDRNGRPEDNNNLNRMRPCMICFNRGFGFRYQYF